MLGLRELDNRYKPDKSLLLTSIFANCGSNATASRMAAKCNWIIGQLLAVWIKICFSSCGDLIQTESGDIRFPVNGGNVGERTQCVWTISVPERFRVKLTFTDFVMKTTCCSCRHDYLEIRDGLLHNSTLIGRYCANRQPKYVYSSQNVIWIKFGSDFRTFEGNRFRLSYEAVCGRHFSETSGGFSSFGFPLSYKKTRDCIYSIEVPKGRIKVKFDSFSLEGRMPICLYDFLEVREIRSVELSSFQGQPRRRRYCGNEKPPIIYSTRGSYLFFRFKSNDSGGKSGFVASYRTISVGEGTCDGVLKDKSGLIYSLNYPYRFPVGKECVWKIQVASEMHVHLYFDTLEFGSKEQGCQNANLEIFDGSDISSHKIGRYCGDLIPSKIVSRTNELTIRAVSKLRAQETGWFSLRYESSPVSVCGLAKFTCTNRQCVDSYFKCDGKKDCSDGSDENGCSVVEESNVFTWYRFWPVSIVGGMLIVGVWLWRAWKKIMLARSQLENNHTTTLPPSQIEMLPSVVTGPPSYTEAVAQDNRPPPSYEEALREQTSPQHTERDSSHEIVGDSTTDHRTDNTVTSPPENTPTSPVSSMVVYRTSASPYDSHRSPYDNHRMSSDSRSSVQRV